jgi:hypothetical protein
MTLLGQFCEAAFERIEADGTRLIAVRPKPAFAPVFGAGLASHVVRTCAAKRTSPLSPPPMVFLASTGAISVAGIDWMIERLHGV